MNKDLQKFIIIESAVSDQEINENTEIENDLGVSGDDAIEFIIAYGKMFNVDVSKFDAGNYFYGEGQQTLSMLNAIFFPKSKSREKNLTVGHLEKGMETGVLDEKTINLIK